LQDSLPGGVVDSSASVQRAIHRPNGNVRQLRNQVNTASLLSHWKTPASNPSTKHAFDSVLRIAKLNTECVKHRVRLLISILWLLACVILVKSRRQLPSRDEEKTSY